ncbi:MAG: hypothetical protein RIM99_04605 [Cyclobacteriaceae bacterium]
MKNKLNLTEFVLSHPTLPNSEQRRSKGAGIWINGIYVSDYQLWLAEQYAITPDSNPEWWGWDNNNNNGQDYYDDHYGTSTYNDQTGEGYLHPDQTVHTIMNGVAGTASIGSLAADISTIVDNLSAAELNKVKAFGSKIGLAGIAITTADMVYGVWEEGEFDANDALVLAGAALGVAAIVASGPIAVTLGVTSMVVGFWAGSGAGEDDVLIGGYY